jgi:hypothetical protein
VRMLYPFIDPWVPSTDPVKLLQHEARPLGAIPAVLHFASQPSAARLRARSTATPSSTS